MVSQRPPPLICGPLPVVAALGVFVPSNDPSKLECCIAQDPKAWPSHSNISYTFLGPKPDDWKLELVEDAIAEYTRYANVNLICTSDDNQSADIRVSFDGNGGAWSAIGTDALKIDEGPTMNLDFLSKKPENLGEGETYRNLTLHQFGHAFGLAHEWHTEWATLQDRGSEAIKQHNAAFKQSPTSNFLDPDKNSIMKFFAPSNYIQTGQLTPLDGFSDNDKAWLTLIYPGKAGGADEDTGILHSLNVLNVPLEVSSRILLGSTVSEMRFHYHECISEKWEDGLSTQVIDRASKKFAKQEILAKDLRSKSHVLKGKVSGITPLVDHNSEDDLYDAVAAAVLDPQFRQVLANVVNQGDGGQPDVQNRIFMSGINPQAPPDVQNFIGPLLTSVLLPMLGQLIFSGLPTGAASGIYPQALPPAIEQGIFNKIFELLKHPMVINVVKDVATDMIKQHEKSKAEEE